MSLKFYTDAHIPKQVAVQLRNRGVDVIRCQEVGMMDAADPDHLEYASREDRALVSIDRDFQEHYWEWLAQDKPHAGIFKVSRQLQGKRNIGPIVKTLFEYYQLIEAGAGTLEADIHNQIIVVE
ncbi:MAG: DUF5615 family PIN-like protein [Chloroflexi bacterium]|nr:hypothetical protein [Chloroflexota bacterium]NOG66395.1 DUF5615 family PIN-like protein [Chloroflexota bacterium]